MPDPLPELTWLDAIKQNVVVVAISILSAIGTVMGVLWAAFRRLEKAERIALQVEKAMADLQEDLSQHENEDYYEFNQLHEKLDQISGPVVRVEEATGWVKKYIEELRDSVKKLNEDRTYTHERIAEHDTRSRAAAAQYEKEVMEIIETKERRIVELEAQVAVLTK